MIKPGALLTGVAIISREKGRSYGQLKEEKHASFVLRSLLQMLHYVRTRAAPIKSRRLGEATLQNHRKLDHRPE